MPPAVVRESTQNEYLFDGCIEGKGYSIGWSLPDIIEEYDPKTASELFALIISVTEDLSSLFIGSISYNSLDVITAPLLRDSKDSSLLYSSLTNFLSSIKELDISASFSIDIIPPDDLADDYAEYQTEVDMFNDVFSDVIRETCSKSVFEPSIILNLHDETIWNHSTLEKYLAIAYKYGNPIIQNKISSTIAFEFTRPRNREKDVTISYQRIGGPNGNADDTGVSGYLCLNLAKMGYDAVSEEDFFSILDAQIEEASEILETHRSKISTENVTSILNTDWLYSSIVLTGMNEGLQYLIDAPLGHVAGKAVTYKVREFLRRKIEQIQLETGSLYVLESYPAEEKNDSIIQDSGLTDLLLTRGTELPYSHGNDLWDVLEHQKKLQSMYTGATLMEIHVKEGLQYNEGCKLLTRRIIDEFGFNYLAITPSNIYDDNGEKVRVTRVDGIMQKLDTLSQNYKEVHGKRVHYDVKNR